MGKTIKLSEKDLHNLIRKKIMEALEHNVDLEFSPAIGNKKRGPGKNSMDQMRKRRNKKMDEGIDEKPIYITHPNGYVDYDGEDGDDYPGCGNYWLQLDEIDYSIAFRETFGKELDDVQELIERYDLPEEIQIYVKMNITSDPGDYMTPPSGEAEIESWDIVSDISGFDENIQRLIKSAAECAVESLTPEEMVEYINEEKSDKNMKKNIIKINENTLRKIVSESVKKVLKEGRYNPTPAEVDVVKTWTREIATDIANDSQGNAVRAAENALMLAMEWAQELGKVSPYVMLSNMRNNE